ncbi:hypothetical protein FRC02_006993 [Tulasnella sp. 418]|nr:hypothetical protein FRC02_006993 [Tulasnella sp. 418]
MLAFVNTCAAFILLIPAVFAGALVPRRSTPNFYLVATSTSADYHLKYLRVNQYDGSLTTGTAGKFYLDGVRLRQDKPNDPNTPWVAYIDFSLTGTGCTTDGPLKIVPGSSSNKCAQSVDFHIASYDQNAQLGAKLDFNWKGGFYGCTNGVVRSAWLSLID